MDIENLPLLADEIGTPSGVHEVGLIGRSSRPLRRPPGLTDCRQVIEPELGHAVEVGGPAIGQHEQRVALDEFTEARDTRAERPVHVRPIADELLASAFRLPADTVDELYHGIRRRAR
jgi:hypothetical protein